MRFPFNLFAFVTGMVQKWVVSSFLLKSFVFLFLVSSAMAGGSRPSFTLRFYMQAGISASSAQTLSMAVPDPDQIIKVNKYAVLTEKNVESLMKLPDGGTLVTFSDTGMKIMETETSNNMGVIMVVLCNGRLIYAPEIDAPLRSGKILLPKGLTEADYTMFRQYKEKQAKQ